MGDFYNTIAWGSSVILGALEHYRFYGDVRIIEENYEAGIKYLEFLKTMVNADGFICCGLGDWGNPEGILAKENVETAFLYADAKTLAGFAAILGRPEEEKKLLAYAEKVRKNYNEKLFVYDPVRQGYGYRLWSEGETAREGEPDQKGFPMTQATLALPLYWGMVPEGCEEQTAVTFRRMLEEDGCLKTGEVSQPYVIRTASKHGMNDLISAFITREEHPSYYAFVRDGMTTLGEYWEKNPRSWCHDMLGHIAEWFYSGIAGITSLVPGFQKVLVRPYLPRDIGSFSCSYESASGKISVEARREGKTILLKVSAEEGIVVETDPSLLRENGAEVIMKK